ncbi:MAG: AAA family ATPase [Chitinophagaceae bacterium]|nr:AAA family ATPase [Chitinophagaceae bacterium]
MVRTLKIKNYKSIKDISLHPKRVNIFIGEHNSGKSNILEALSWFSVNALEKAIFSQLFRFKNAGNFFFDFDSTQTIEVTTDDWALKIRYARNSQGALLNHFEGIIYKTMTGIIDPQRWDKNSENSFLFNLDFQQNNVAEPRGIIDTAFRTYSFKRQISFSNNYRPYLNPPFGENIPTLLLSNKELRQIVSDFFRSKDHRLVMKPNENDIEMAKDVNDDLYSFPFVTISETMQRYIFGMLAIRSNKDAVLIMDEPETNMFPFFVKDFSESIADDESNQFFITTHNPFMLGSLLEKTPLKDLAVFITSMKNYETHVQECTTDQIREIISLGSGALFNLDNIID